MNEQTEAEGLLRELVQRNADNPDYLAAMAKRLGSEPAMDADDIAVTIIAAEEVADELEAIYTGVRGPINVYADDLASAARRLRDAAGLIRELLDGAVAWHEIIGDRHGKVALDRWWWSSVKPERPDLPRHWHRRLTPFVSLTGDVAVLRELLRRGEYKGGGMDYWEDEDE